MKKLVLSVFAFALVCGFAFALSAKVTFLANDKASVGARGTGSGDCQGQGYVYSASNCSNGLAVPCPTDDRYFKVCCPSGYKYTKEECVSNAKPLSTMNCYGYYKCEMDQ